MKSATEKQKISTVIPPDKGITKILYSEKSNQHQIHSEIQGVLISITKKITDKNFRQLIRSLVSFPYFSLGNYIGNIKMSLFDPNQIN